MTSVLSAGRYKQKKEWSTQSIPELVSNHDSNEDVENSEPHSSIEIQVNGVPQQFQSARRTSLAIGLFPGDDSETARKFSQHMPPPKNNKRRSSIATAFLGRKDNAKVNVQRSAGGVRTGSNCFIANNPQSKSDEPTKRSSVFYNDDDGTADYHLSDKDPRRKRRSSWQAKMERRRRKSLANTRIDENSVTIVVDKAVNNDDDDDSDNDLEQQGSQYMSRGVGMPLGAAGSPYQRQKRNSWWNILVPDNLKSRWIVITSNGVQANG